MPGEGTEVGRIVGYLILDRSDWRTGIEAAKAEARSLGRESPTVRVDVKGAAAAVAELKAVDAAGRKAGGRGGGPSLLITAIAALGPALVPVGAAAVTAGAGLAGLGVAGVLAIAGIRREMQAGTPTGRAYSSMLGELGGDLHDLEATAAHGVLSGFQAGVVALRPLMPTLNADTAQLSGQLGGIASHVMPGLVSLFTTFNPLLTQLGADLVHGSASFEQWASSSTGVSKFVLYAQTELPKVEHVLGEVAGAVGHVVSAVGPLGGTVLTSLGVLSSVVRHMPVGMLTALATAFALLRTAGLGLTVLKAVAGNIDRVRFAALKMGAGGSGAAAGLGLMGGAGLVAGGLLFGLTTIMSEASAKAQRLAQDTQDYTQALRDSHGAITQQVSDLVLQKAVQDGSTELFAKAGITINQWVDAVEHGGKAYDDLRGKLLHTIGPASLLNSTLYEQRKAFESGSQANQGYTAGQKALGIQSVTTAAAARKAANEISGLQQQIDGLRGSELSATAVTGYMVAALAALSGNAVTAEQDSLHLKDAMAGLAEQTKTNGHSLDENTAKGRANKESLLDLITQANAHSAAVLAQTGSVNAATGALKSDETAIRNAATAAGLNKTQVDKLITSYAAVPSDVSTKVKANIKQAQDQITILEDQISTLQLQSHIITITTYLKQVILPGVRGPSAGERHHASGGEVGGSGGPRSDDQLIWASSKEFVVNAAAYAKNKPLIQSINAGAVPKVYAGGGAVSAYARGGQVSAPMTNGRRGKPMQIKVKVELTTDSGGNMRAWVRDIVADEADFAGTAARM
jgi:hypothetical protein